MSDQIVVRGARQHNLQHIDVEIPRDRLVVITGISGSGKSSLAFDTIYAEGRRRYVESLSSYARQFLGQMDRPEVELIEGLSPTVAIDQKGVNRNPRSTVGTTTEIYDYLRLLFARAGRPHCPGCGRPITRQTPSQIVDRLLSFPDGARQVLMAPVVRERKGAHQQVLDDLRKSGYVRVRVDGEIRPLEEEIELDRYRAHTIEVVVDRLILRRDEAGGVRSPDRGRLTDSVETALRLGDGILLVAIDGEEHLFSEHLACAHCGISIDSIEPRTFSFNSPHGACPHCGGLGTVLELDPDLIVPDQELSLADGAIAAWKALGRQTADYFRQFLHALADHYGFSIDLPVRKLTPDQMGVVLYGSNGEIVSLRYRGPEGDEREVETTFEGVIPHLRRRHRETNSARVRSRIERFMAPRTCPRCRGARLRPESLAVKVDGRSIAQVAADSIARLRDWVALLAGERTPLSEREARIAESILRELRTRLAFLCDVGLDYLTLDRTTASLAGGEVQRIRLGTQIGASLMGCIYVLDEPSIGLHARDGARLIETLRQLRDQGNTVLVVEHDAAMIRAADWVIDMGPGAGDRGGRIVSRGTPEQIVADPDSVTGLYLSGRRSIPVPRQRRPCGETELVLVGARAHNLKDLTVRIPLGCLVCVTGVSGSGKSTLVSDTLFRRLAQLLHGAQEPAGSHDALHGVEQVDKVVAIDQSPIGRTPRSNAATYTGVFSSIRRLFARVPESRVRGYKPSRFSFNVKGGRCEACEGAGVLQIEMQFLPDVYVPCEVCQGSRYNRETLEIRYKGLSIAQVLDMTVSEAIVFFANVPSVRKRLRTLQDVGLGYLKLGQPAPSLSGGEAQRVKLAAELSRRATGQTLYVLDEPTTGLHFADIERLLVVLNRLVDAGNTVVVIEHNLDVIKAADWIIDLGPEGGQQGGQIVAQGPPEEVVQVSESHTGRFLEPLLGPDSIDEQGDFVYNSSEKEAGPFEERGQRLEEPLRRS